jgi:hypothetical protein
VGSGGWRWWFRRECRAIAEFETGPSGVIVMLCVRRRWHRGAHSGVRLPA